MTPEETFTRDFHKRLSQETFSQFEIKRSTEEDHPSCPPPARPPALRLNWKVRTEETRKEKGERREERGERRKKKEERRKTKKEQKNTQKTAKNTQNHKKYAGGVQTRMDVIALLTPVCIDPITTRFASVPAAPSGSGESR